MKENLINKLNIMIMLIPLLVFISGLHGNAAEPSILEIASVPSDGQKMAAEYEFIGKFTSKTSVSTFGSGWKKTKTDTGSEYWSVIPSSGQGGSVGVLYENIGIYEGKIIDLKITIMGWSKYMTTPGNISYSTVSIGHHQQGYQYVDQKWEFVQSGTDKAVDVSGYMTINDIDSWQGIQFSKTTTSAIKNIYVSAKTNRIKFENLNGEYHFYDSIGGNRDTYDQDDMFTFTYRGQSALRFKWTKDYAGHGYSAAYTWDTSKPNGEYFGFIAKKPLATATAAPSKTVSDSDEKNKTSNTLEDRWEPFVYEVTHAIPDEWKDYYYSSYEFSDTLEDCLEAESLKIYNLAGTDISSNFDINIKGNPVTASAKKSFLETSGFYYNTYTFQIRVKIKENADLSKYKKSNVFLLKNQASVSIDGDKGTSGEVETKVPPKIHVPDILKMIVDGEELVERQQVQNGEKVKFYGEAKIPDDKLYKQIKITDDLHSCFTYSSFQIFDSSGNDITSKGETVSEGQRVTFAFSQDYAKNLMGKEVCFYLEASVDANGDFSDVSDGEVPNSFRLLLDGEIESNEVYVKVPVKKNYIQKVILESENSETEELVLEGNEREIVFRGYAQITNTEKIKSIILEDELHPSFRFRDLCIYNIEGTDITEKGYIQQEENIIRYIFHEETVSELSGKRIKWEISANYIGGSDLSELEEGKIPNTMKLYVNEDKKESNEVTVTPVPEVDEIRKSIIMPDGSEVLEYELADNSEEIIFEGKAKVNNTSKIKKIILEDELHPALQYISMTVYDWNGESITDQGDVERDGQKVRFILEEEAEKFCGQPLSWKMRVKYIEGSDISGAANGWIPNKMKLTVNEDETESNEVMIRPVPMENTIVKSIVLQDGKQVDSYELKDSREEVIFCGTASVKNDQQISVLTLKDTLEEGLVPEVSSVYVTADGEDITSWGEVSLNEENILAFTVQKEAQRLAGAVLSWTFLVKYDSDLDFTKDQTRKNVMELLVDEEEITSNEVQIKPPLKEQPKEKKAKPVFSPRTGDKNKKGVYIILMVVCTAFGGYKWRRKKEQ